MSLLVKICQACGLTYRRPTGSSKVSDTTWKARKYCSSICGLQSTGQHSDHSNPGAPSTFDPLRQNATLGSDQLLDRIMGVYARVAKERGLNDVWEAAVTLGMAA